MAEAEILNTMRSFPGGPPVKVLLLGEENVGKTAMARLVANYKHAIESASEDLSWKRALMTLHQASLQISKTKGRVQRSEVTLDGGALIQFVDMPGAECREGRDDEGEECETHKRHLKDAIRHTDYLNCAILVVDGSKAKMPASVAHELKVIASLMPSSFLEKIVVVATHSESPQKRVLPASDLRETFGREPLIIHLENPFGRLGGLKEADLKQEISGHGPENDNDETPAAEIRRAVRKSVRTMSEVLRTLKPFGPTSVPAPQGEGSFNAASVRAAAARGREIVTSFTNETDPGFLPSLEIYSKLFMPPVFNNDMVTLPLSRQPDWRKMFEAWNIINATIMVVCSIFYFVLESILDIASFSLFSFIRDISERFLHTLAFLIFSHVTWYNAVRKGRCGVCVHAGPHYYLICAVVFLYFWLECVWVAKYKIFFIPVMMPTLYLCLICFRLYELEKQTAQAEDLQPVGTLDVELSPNLAAKPLAT